MIHIIISEYLKHTKTTGKQLADSLGISDSYMSMLRLGQRRPSPELVQRIEAASYNHFYPEAQGEIDDGGKTIWGEDGAGGAWPVENRLLRAGKPGHALPAPSSPVSARDCAELRAHLGLRGAWPA